MTSVHQPQVPCQATTWKLSLWGPALAPHLEPHPMFSLTLEDLETFVGYQPPRESASNNATRHPHPPISFVGSESKQKKWATDALDGPRVAGIETGTNPTAATDAIGIATETEIGTGTVAAIAPDRGTVADRRETAPDRPMLGTMAARIGGIEVETNRAGQMIAIGETGAGTMMVGTAEVRWYS